MSDVGVVRPQDLSKAQDLKRQNRKEFRRFRNQFIFKILIKPFKEIAIKISDAYSILWENKKKVFIFSFIVFICYTLFNGIMVLMDGESFFTWLKKVGIAILLFLALKVLILAIHGVFGYLLVIKSNLELSEKYINTKLPKIAKISGVTGAGKDTFMRAIGSIKRRAFVKDINDRMEYIKRNLYYINFSKFNELIENDSKAKEEYQMSKYASIDFDNLVKVAALDLKRNGSLIKSRYKSEFIANEMINDYALFIQAPRFHLSKYVIDKKIDSEHALALIAEYIYLYFRLNIDKHFLISNQPSIEDLKDKIMCKQFSLDYFKLIHETIQKNTSIGKIESTEKVVFGLTDYMVIMESEVDSFYNNLDKKINFELLNKGVRDAFAYNRHLFGENFNYYQVGQNASRCASLIRELTHSFIYIVGRKNIDGGRVRRFLLNLVLVPVNFWLDLFEIIYEYRQKKLQLKKDIEAKRLALLYNSTHDKKYKARLDKLKSQEYPARKFISARMERFSSRLTILRERLKNNGWIEVTISINSSASSLSNNTLSLRQILKKNLDTSNCQTKIIFKRTDSHGLYDTHYLKALKKNLESKSDVNFYSISCWSPDMLLKKQDAIITNYKVLDKFFDITTNERFTYSYDTHYIEEY